ncbi:MAG: hypothetical protein K0Q59_1274, partial [Paenibacillus sp.]|nr:hypothetical protein [Paenibacillus sp.]
MGIVQVGLQIVQHGNSVIPNRLLFFIQGFIVAVKGNECA